MIWASSHSRVLGQGARLTRLTLFLGITFLQMLFICQSVHAETWVMVAKSDTTQEQQYVDADSIENTGSIVRLKTHWGFLDQPDSINYATTEYRCETGEYRDVIVNDRQTGDEWQPVGTDPLNRAAMEYGCRQGRSPMSSARLPSKFK